jgi:TRAP-type C4-dicarboxylate transport system substrate-binding protein
MKLIPRALVASIAIALAVASAPSLAATLKFATLLPDGTSYMTAMRKGGKEIEKLTEGRVKLKFYPGGVMGNDESVMRKIRIGQLAGGAVTGIALVNYSKDAQLYGVPFLFNNVDEINYVRSKIDDEIFAELESNGMIVLGMAGGGFSYLMASSPITETTSLKNHKVWIPEGDELSSKALQLIDVSPVSLPISDVYTGLQTGLIDVIGSSAAGVIALQWHTKITHVTDVPINYLTGWLVVGQKAMRKVLPADQVIVRQVLGEKFADLDVAAWGDEDKARAALISSGIKIVKPEPEEEARWRSLGQQATDAVKGGKMFSDARLAKVKKLLADYRATN